ncbi:hypothetical protein MASR2M44_29040 [Bacteroidota bacterium]
MFYGLFRLRDKRVADAILATIPTAADPVQKASALVKERKKPKTVLDASTQIKEILMELNVN